MKKYIVTVLLFGFAFVAAASWPLVRATAEDEYNTKINAVNFVAEITNKYFTLSPCKKFEFKSSDGTERKEILVTRETKKILGVTTIIVQAREWKNNVLKEDTRDWYAQDKEGNVWY